MEAIHKVVQNYVDTMRPEGLLLSDDLQKWCKTDPAYSTVSTLADRVHKFAGSAGSTGFTRLSMIATLLELGLRAAQDENDLSPLAVDQISVLAKDFHTVIEALSPEQSSFVTGEEFVPFSPCEDSGHVLLVELPRVIEAILSFVVEQCLAIPLSVPERTMLESIVPERAPKLAVVSEDVPSYSFSVLLFKPMSFDQLTSDWL